MNCFASVFVIVAALVAVSQANVNDPKLKSILEQCIGSEKASPADIAALEARSSDLSKEAKCVISCVMKNYKLLSDDGKVNRDVFMTEAEEMTKGDAGAMKEAGEMFEICSAKTVADPCESAFNFGHCMKTEMTARNIPMDF
ncbi:unnamed protein product [Hermetia illucens]|uniref:Uncharacterized protein n=1 Tax=Hermetia illucens TaxID=343691 RepID=A0A7R8UEL8_HERIL|nr:general odorant-binding protein 19d-like [Hermetia illucens]CAD7079376.1 unnamed protein product [Hermetia illucens]